MILDTFGGRTVNSSIKIAQQLSNLESRNEKSETSANQRFSMISDLEPQDTVEAMLASQMIAVHDMMMSCSSRALNCERTFEGRELNFNSVTKLSRSFVSLVDALNKHRGKGQQKMTVEHVTVEQGGQAFVGSVEGTNHPLVFGESRARGRGVEKNEQ